MVCLSVKSYSRKNGHKKTLVKRVQSRLVAIRPHQLSLTTLPGEAGWYGSNPCLDARLNFVAILEASQASSSFQLLPTEPIGDLLRFVCADRAQNHALVPINQEDHISVCRPRIKCHHFLCEKSLGGLKSCASICPSTTRPPGTSRIAFDDVST